MVQRALALVLLAAAASAGVTWVLARTPSAAEPAGAPDGHAARIAALEAEIDRLQRRADAALEADPAAQTAPASTADDDAPVSSVRPLTTTTTSETPAVTLRGFVKTKRQIQDDVPPGMRGTPAMWIEGMRIALEKGDTALAGYYRMALVALGEEAVEPALALLEREGVSGALRLEAARALRHLDPTRLARAAAHWFGVPREPGALRTALLRALEKGDVPLPAPVARLAWDPGTPAADRGPAISALMRADPDDATRLLRGLLFGDDEAERTLARARLERIRDPRYRALVQEVVEEADEQTRRRFVGTLAAMKGAAWGDVQLTGPPDTPFAADAPTAWASRTQSEGAVTIELDFPTAVVPETLRVHETYNAGAIVRVEARVDGRFVPLFESEARAAGTPRWFTATLARIETRVQTLRLTLDTDTVPGWNELDAVELLGDGTRQWASAARSSSCYARR